MFNNVQFFPAETVKFRVVWKKKTFDVTFGLDEKAIKLKEHIQTLTGHIFIELIHNRIIRDLIDHILLTVLFIMTPLCVYTCRYSTQYDEADVQR